MSAEPSWLVTEQETADEVAAWARSRGLAFERTGLLPAVSEELRVGVGAGWHTASVLRDELLGGAIRHYGGSANRPERFSENVCSGVLAPGVEGSVAHHFGAQRIGADHGWAVRPCTAAVAHVPAAPRVVRDVRSRRQAEGVTIVLREPDEPAYGRLYTEPDLTPGLGERFTWLLWFEDDADLVAQAFDEAVVAALADAPEVTSVMVREGRVAVAASRVLLDVDGLGRLVRVAAALGQALVRCAATLPDLDLATPLPPPPDTPLRRWVLEGAARLEWPEPPRDVASAVKAYAEPGERRGLFRRRARASETESEAWGLEAFAAGYARARGLTLEDREELRRRVAFPFPVSIERSFHGTLADGVPGRVLLGADPSEVSEVRYLNVAIAAAPEGEITAQEPFVADVHDGLLFVRQRVAMIGRAAERLDALVAETARLSGALSPRTPTRARDP